MKISMFFEGVVITKEQSAIRHVRYSNHSVTTLWQPSDDSHDYVVTVWLLWRLCDFSDDSVTTLMTLGLYKTPFSNGVFQNRVCRELWVKSNNFFSASRLDFQIFGHFYVPVIYLLEVHVVILRDFIAKSTKESFLYLKSDNKILIL